MEKKGETEKQVCLFFTYACTGIDIVWYCCCHGTSGINPTTLKICNL